jgi:hypothetical protein
MVSKLRVVIAAALVAGAIAGCGGATKTVTTTVTSASGSTAPQSTYLGPPCSQMDSSNSAGYSMCDAKGKPCPAGWSDFPQQAGACQPTATTSDTTSTQTSSAGPSGGQSFSGNGAKRLGTVTVNADSTVNWTNDGDIFQVFDNQSGFGINSQGHSGTSAVAAGTYTNVQVNAIGNWTLKISPG